MKKEKEKSLYEKKIYIVFICDIKENKGRAECHEIWRSIQLIDSISFIIFIDDTL